MDPRRCCQGSTHAVVAWRYKRKSGVFWDLSGVFWCLSGVLVSITPLLKPLRYKGLGVS